MTKVKMIRVVSYILIIAFFIPISSHSSEFSEKDVVKLIGLAEQKVNEMKKNNILQYAGYELSKVEFYINQSKTLLKEGKTDQAYYEMKIGIEYFKMAEARLQLFNAQKDFEKAERESKKGSEDK